jgi:hypothetical protein
MKFPFFRGGHFETKLTILMPDASKLVMLLTISKYSLKAFFSNHRMLQNVIVATDRCQIKMVRASTTFASVERSDHSMLTSGFKL